MDFRAGTCRQKFGIAPMQYSLLDLCIKQAVNFSQSNLPVSFITAVKQHKSDLIKMHKKIPRKAGLDHNRL
ncbi:hypothetical protein SAMN05444280_1675 [Tangfeifania diversioriginum]|uniref:Uncharacterized protein n=1 Tax=Tangfeifania diversioriginum TaxID=1168035 RepID=A0A1M6PPB2_9BACT|nr:hypothetical protein [Tangfeifania diversioriginum]SHK09775.1 hypothetical protein SAMN05444280_1675 [Tangfeifania diversioriginum]